MIIVGHYVSHYGVGSIDKRWKWMILECPILIHDIATCSLLVIWIVCELDLNKISEILCTKGGATSFHSDIIN